MGGKKDAEYLAGVMEEEIFKFDPERMHTDVSILMELPMFKRVV